MVLAPATAPVTDTGLPVVPVNVTLPLLLLHVPPAVASLSVIVTPTHSELEPCIGVTLEVTVNTAIAGQPPAVYETVVVPVYVLLAVTRPVELPMVAMSELLRLHVPPTVASVSVVVLPPHKESAPPIADGAVPTVMVAVLVQPVAAV